MSRNKQDLANSHWFTKSLILIGAGACLLLGLVGIVLPVIPGLLFLALAVWLVARVSRRAADYLNSHPQWQRQQRFWDRTQHLSLAQRAQLGFWLSGRILVDGGKRLYERFCNRNSRY